jgi:neutral ceramidase
LRNQRFTKDVLLAGFGERDLEAPLGASMPGYFADRKATATLDPLMAKVLYLRLGSVQGAFVSVDLVGLEAAEANACRSAVSKRTGIPVAHVWIHATHTHTGTMIPRTLTSDAEKILGTSVKIGEVDAGWLAQFPDRVADAVEAAVKAAKPGPVKLAETNVEGLAFYRRFKVKDGTVRTNPGRGNPEVVGPAGHADPALTLLGFPESRTLLAVFGLHTDTVGGTGYSADYPAHMAKFVREGLGAGWNLVFLNAACGNINHINIQDPNQLGGPAEATRIGRALGEAAVKAWAGARPIEVDTLTFASRTVPSRLRTVPEADVKEAERVLKEEPGRAMPFNGFHAASAKVLGRTADREQDAEISVARIGPVGLAAMPGEVFVELARQVQHDSPFEPTRLIGLTNGLLGYIPHAEAYAQGGYESCYLSARFEPRTGHRWAEAAVALLKQLAQAGRA